MIQQPRFVELLTKELTEGLTAAEKQELDQLFQQNPLHRTQTTILKDYWNTNSIPNTSDANFKKVMDAIAAAEPIRQAKTGKLWPVLRSIAALLIVGTTLILWQLSVNFNKKASLATNWQVKITPPKVKERLVLPDGTTVTLNSGTAFRYPLYFGNKTREVYLNGEAYFDVHKDHAHPFIIHTQKMNVKVLGTAFNIKAFDKEQHRETSLIHGSIEVTLNDRTSDRIILKPHEKLIIQNNLNTKIQTNIPTGSTPLNTAMKGTQYALTNLTYIPNIDSAAIETLWLKNKLVFKNEDFESIADDMERWYGIQIVFKHEALKKLRFTATFERESAMQALESLRITEDFHLKKNGSVYYIFN